MVEGDGGFTEGMLFVIFFFHQGDTIPHHFELIYINWNIDFKMVILKLLFILKIQAVECKYLVDVCVYFVP